MIGLFLALKKNCCTIRFRPLGYMEPIMLDIERKFLDSHRDDLVRQFGGRFLVIKGEEVTGAFDSINEALQGAVLKHGLDNVLIRRAADMQIEVSIPALTLGIINADVPHTTRSSN